MKHQTLSTPWIRKYFMHNWSESVHPYLNLCRRWPKCIRDHVGKSQMILTCITEYCENRRLSTALNTATPMITLKQTEHNTSLDFIIEKPIWLVYVFFILPSENTVNVEQKIEQETESTSIKREYNCYVPRSAMNRLKITRLHLNAKTKKYMYTFFSIIIHVNTHAVFVCFKMCVFVLYWFKLIL